MPFGFPSGQQLIDQLLEQALHFDGDDRFDAMHEMHADEGARRALKLSGFPSIDQFLEKQERFHGWGRLRVSKIILEAEKQYLMASRTLSKRTVVRTGREEQIEIGRYDWLQQLWSQFLDCPLAEFEKHKVSFITYNYDRLIEQVLWAAMSTIYSDHAAVRQALVKIPVLHLHGSLGPLRMGEDDPNPNAVGFGINATAGNLRTISQNWKFVWERPQNSPDVQTAVEILASAERVVVMGLGAAVEVVEPLVNLTVEEREGLRKQQISLPARTEVHVCNRGLMEGETAHLEHVLSPLCIGNDLRLADNVATGSRSIAWPVPVKPILYGHGVDAFTMLRTMMRLDLPVVEKREEYFGD